jgi:hypothetical protein
MCCAGVIPGAFVRRRRPVTSLLSDLVDPGEGCLDWRGNHPVMWV